MKPDWPMLIRPVKPKWMFRPMAAIATAAVCGEIASRTIAFRIDWMVSMSRPSSTHPLGATEQALRTHQQQQDQDQQCSGVLEVTRHPEDRRELDDQADDDRPDERPERGAETAEGHRGEEQQQDLHAGVPLDAVGDQGVEQA